MPLGFWITRQARAGQADHPRLRHRHATHGLGHRPIAAGLQIPEETVRGWPRQARRSVDRIRRRAADALFHIDPDMFARLAPLGSALADALNMLFTAAAATAHRHHLESGLPVAHRGHDLRRSPPRRRPRRLSTEPRFVRHRDRRHPR
ncbi:hypothetical protein Pth03_58940 [Planotetraspora thailandica]|uniref:Uncharacterized protein n=1 Tax=Planotetraspora thailandica TaxID=487172 RepID=A0A8J3V7K9_9ACTN|nr:hypothetical protein [Planotetraspora thailandica]GII57505.1 hypothetical protein Pth03_58940 [Planotetraspora thailandica]